MNDQSAKNFAKITADLVALRRSHEALRDADADQVPLAHTNETMSFARVAHSGAAAVVAFNNSDQSQRMTLPVGEKIGAHDGVEFEEPLADGQRLHVSGGQLHVELPPNGLRVFLRA